MPIDQAHFEKALGYMEAKSYDQAVIIFNQLLTTYPKLAGAYVNLALISQNNSDDEQAQFYYKKALEINPNNVEALIQFAVHSQKSGEFKESERYLLTAEALDKSNETVQYNLAVLYELYLQDFDEAIDHYKNYIVLSSNSDTETVERWIKLLERK